jgi:hypothetical protein
MGAITLLDAGHSQGGRVMGFTLRRVLLPLVVSVLLAGCGSVVREDRTITFAQDGQQFAFQHGRDGVFLAETEGAAPTKIFQPDEDVIAVSTPSWSPIDKRLIFTTAKRVGKDQNGRGGLPAEQDAAGDYHAGGPALYTCWLFSEPKPGQPLNVPLFTARCGHSGYVAANLAVRWHPDGQRLLYIEENGGRHGLFEYDLQTKTSRQVFPHEALDLIFDWAPDNRHLVCVLGGIAPTTEFEGIWIGLPGEDKWWHVPDSATPSDGVGSGLLSRSREARPIWTPDSNHFVFITSHKDEDPVAGKVAANPAPERRLYKLHVGALDTRTVETWTRTDKALRDLHWRPDGARLGFVCGDETGVFHLIDPTDKSERAIGGADVCHFLGWDAAGEQLAFVARQPLPQDPLKSWAFLLLPDVRARNLVRVAPDSDPAKTRSIFSGLQVTFPHWSHKEPKLSMWATFRPPYRSWLSHLLELNGDTQDPLRGLTLRPGDPALVLDPTTGERSWKAINAHEQTQIGHYHLLHREYAEAWQWYEQAAAGAADAEDHSPQQFVQRFVQGHDALFFHAYCLDKLGRDKDAQTIRRHFDATFLPDLPAAPKAPAPGQLAAFGAADLQPTKEQLLHWRDLYCAEVFLSLDAVEDGERFFRDALKAADADADRLSKALILTQFLLLRNKHEEYANLATDTVLPLLLRTWKPRPQTGAPQQQANLVLAYSDGLSLVPLFAPAFLAQLSDRQVRELVPRWEKLRPTAEDDLKRLGIDLFLEAAARRLGQHEAQQAAGQRIAYNPARNDILGDKGVSGLIEGVRMAPEFFEGARQMMAKTRAFSR